MKNFAFICYSGIDSKQIGITLYELKKAFDLRSPVLRTRMIMFKRLVQLLVENFLVLKVGVVERVFVAHEFKQHWVIQSLKNQKGRGDHGSLGRDDERKIEDDNEVISTDNEAENETNL